MEAANLIVSAVPHLRLSADAGDVEAQALLAGVLLDYVDESALPLAFEYAVAAARAGHPAAQRTLGFMYLHGRGVETSAFQAEVLFAAAARAGDPYGAFNLAVMHVQGTVRFPDQAECVRLLRQAVDGGVGQAAAVLGDQLSAVDEDAEALTWYVYAAERGHAGSMFAAACWYRDGIGTSVDHVQAVRWYLTMLDRGNGDGIHEAIQLAKQGMPDEQIRAAGRLAGKEAEAELLITTVRRT
ncbi:tetratricopeptide repeat protein [Streptosporangium roseum]|uniref:tetratricopeptide repeat protein n=1 Tax=Streptosporangium roseum TaxID=2001 RepID=UPI0033299ABF